MSTHDAGFQTIARLVRSGLIPAMDPLLGVELDGRYRLVTEVGYAQAYSFKYSPRPGTPAAAMTDQLPEAVKSERLAMLQEGRRE